MRQLATLYERFEKNESLIQKDVIVLIGLQLTRKAQAVFVAQNSGYQIISTGNVLRSICHSKGMEQNIMNISKIAEDVGELKVLKIGISKALDAMEFTESKGIVVDTVKSLEGMKYIYKRFRKVISVGFLASTTFRFEHSQIRNRPDDAKDKNQFDKRDERELSMGIADLIVMSDFFVIAQDIKSSRNQFHKIINLIEKNEYT